MMMDVEGRRRKRPKTEGAEWMDSVGLHVDLGDKGMSVGETQHRVRPMRRQLVRNIDPTKYCETMRWKLSK